MKIRNLATMLIASAFFLAWWCAALEAGERKDRSARLGKLSCQAGEIPKFDGSRWGCAAGAGTALVLLDGNGEVIGPVIQIEYTPVYRVLVAVEFLERDLDLSFPIEDDLSGILGIAALRFAPLDTRSPKQWDPIVGINDLTFSSNDCSGEPAFLLRPGQQSVSTSQLQFFTLQQGFFLATGVARTNGKYQLWIADTGFGSQFASVESVFDAVNDRCVPREEFGDIGFECVGISGPGLCEHRTYFVQLLDDDLLATFPPPYSIEMR